MASFRDGAGREWRLRLTAGSVADVRRDTGVNLALTSKSADWLDVIFPADEEVPGARLAAVLWALCEGQARSLGVSPEQFAAELDGETLSAAGDALGEAVVDFFPRSRIAQALRGRWRATVTAAEDEVIRRLNSTASPSATSSPGSSGATPAG